MGSGAATIHGRRTQLAVHPQRSQCYRMEIEMFCFTLKSVHIHISGGCDLKEANGNSQLAKLDALDQPPQKKAWKTIREREKQLQNDADRNDFAVIRKAYARAFSRSKGGDFLSVVEAIELYREQNRTCALTGHVFNDAHVHDGKVLKAPWGPSLDKKQTRGSYSRGNVRWTCAIANMARNEWPDEVFIEMCELVVLAKPRAGSRN